MTTMFYANHGVGIVCDQPCMAYLGNGACSLWPTTLDPNPILINGWAEQARGPTSDHTSPGIWAPIHLPVTCSWVIVYWRGCLCNWAFAECHGYTVKLQRREMTSCNQLEGAIQGLLLARAGPRSPKTATYYHSCEPVQVNLCKRKLARTRYFWALSGQSSTEELTSDRRSSVIWYTEKRRAYEGNRCNGQWCVSPTN